MLSLPTTHERNDTYNEMNCGLRKYKMKNEDVTIAVVIY